jgi:hypothetical protein
MAGGLPIAPVAGGPVFHSRRWSAFQSLRRRPFSQVRWPSSRRGGPTHSSPAQPPPHGVAARHLLLHEIPPPATAPSTSRAAFPPIPSPDPAAEAPSGGGGVGSSRGGTVRLRRREIRPRWHPAAAEALLLQDAPSFVKIRRSFKIRRRPEVVVVVN